LAQEQVNSSMFVHVFFFGLFEPVARFSS